MLRDRRAVDRGREVRERHGRGRRRIVGRGERDRAAVDDGLIEERDRADGDGAFAGQRNGHHVRDAVAAGELRRLCAVPEVPAPTTARGPQLVRVRVRDRRNRHGHGDRRLLGKLGDRDVVTRSEATDRVELTCERWQRVCAKAAARLDHGQRPARVDDRAGPTVRVGGGLGDQGRVGVQEVHGQAWRRRAGRDHGHRYGVAGGIDVCIGCWCVRRGGIESRVGEVVSFVAAARDEQDHGHRSHPRTQSTNRTALTRGSCVAATGKSCRAGKACLRSIARLAPRPRSLVEARDEP